ncbi:MAG: hypothetical protein AAYR31_00625 [Candidatus Vidania fulgoroideorum]
MIKKLIYVRKTNFVREGGRKFKYTAYTAVSNKIDKIGISKSKSSDFTNSILKSFKKSKKKIFKFKIFNKTINTSKIFKVGKTITKFFPEKSKGLIIGGNARKIISMTGIKNIICKIYGSKNKINVIKATIKLLKYLKCFI